VPVTIGGVEINPGDVIMGDDDGVVVLGNDLAKIQVTVLLCISTQLKQVTGKGRR